MSTPLEIQSLSFGYPGMAAPLFVDLSLTLAPGWTAIVGANGSGKSTLLDLIAGRHRPDAGRIQSPGSVLLIDQRTDHAPAPLIGLLESADGAARRLVARLGLEPDWPERWATLSHGERKRAQLAVGLWQQPAVLALDEPTNHVDAAARVTLESALQSFAGVGLLVSHDRALIDSLCSQCLFIGSNSTTLRPGGITAGLEQADRDHLAALRERTIRRREQQGLERSAQSRAALAAQADRQRSKRGISKKDHDAKSRIDAARVSGKDGQAGRVQRQLDGRRSQATARLDASFVERRPHLGLTMRGRRSKADRLWACPAGPMPLGGGRQLELPSLVIRPADRIGLTGVNGSGKSTLVARIMRELELDSNAVFVMPQELEATEVAALRLRLAALSPLDQGRVLAAVDALGSDPEPLLTTDRLSPGEARKLMLALGLLNEPALVVLDEPTNHLDLPSIRCLERALVECAAALLLVSHDMRFLAALTTSRWQLEVQSDPGRSVSASTSTQLLINAGQESASQSRHSLLDQESRRTGEQ